MFIYPRIYKKMKRGPQVILPKDIGMIIAYSGVGKDSVCVDAGTGSGWLTVSLARISKHVYGYDVRDDFLKITKHNVDLVGVDNVTLKNQDIFKRIDEKNVDLVTLDLPNAEKAVKNAKKALKPGGCIVGYMPHVEQVKKYVESLEKLGFVDIYTIESIVRDMLVRKEGSRPSTKGVWHTGYLTFARSPIL